MKVVDTAMPAAFDLLADMLANPRFDQEDLEREQKVILEEIKMVEDTPDELLGELLQCGVFSQSLPWTARSKARKTLFPNLTTKPLSFHAQNFAPPIW